MSTQIDWQDVRKRLAEPFPVSELQFRIDGPVKDSNKQPGTKYARVVVYIDARTVQDRLDDVLGPDGWSFDATVNDSVSMKGTITIGGVPKSDVGLGDDRKAQTSDAEKRAGVQWSIGRYLYAMPNLNAIVEPAGKSWKIKDTELARLRAKIAGIMGQNERAA